MIIPYLESILNITIIAVPSYTFATWPMLTITGEIDLFFSYHMMNRGFVADVVGLILAMILHLRIYFIVKGGNLRGSTSEIYLWFESFFD